MSSQRGASTAKKRRELRPQDVQTWDIPEYGQVIQDPLTFFEKAEFLGLVAGAIDRAIAEGIDLEGIATALRFDENTAERLRAQGWGAARDLPGADKLIQAAMRALATTPQLLEDAYLVILSIPPEGREFARPFIQKIDDDTGFGIFDCFIRQNISTLRDFVMRWWEQVSGATTQLQPQTASPAESTPTSTD